MRHRKHKAIRTLVKIDNKNKSEPDIVAVWTKKSPPIQSAGKHIQIPKR